MFAIPEEINTLDESSVEEVWLELIEKECPPEDFLELARKLNDSKKTTFSLDLLKLLSSHYMETRRYSNAVVIQKEILKIDKTKENIALLLKAYENFLSADLSHLSADAEEKKTGALFAMLDKYAPYKPGEFFYDELLGAGKITALRVKENEIVVDFKTQKETFNLNDEAVKYLEKLQPEHFLVVKYENAKAMKEEAANAPAALVKHILRSFEKLPEDRIKSLLRDVVDDVDAWWKKTKPLLKKEKDVRFPEGARKYFSMISPEAMQENAQKDFEDADVVRKLKILKDTKEKFPDLFQTFAACLKTAAANLSADESLLVLFTLYDMKELSAEDAQKFLDGKTLHDLMDALPSVVSKKHRKIIMDDVLKRCDDAEEILAKAKTFNEELFLYCLDASEKLRVKALEYFSSFHKLYPEKFIQMMKYCHEKKLDAGNKSELLRKMLDVLSAHKELRVFSHDLIDVEHLDFEELSEEDAVRLQSQWCGIFSEDAKTRRDFKMRLQREFPSLVSDEEEVLYATKDAIARKEEELRRIKSVDIPKNTDEIARARGHGDLSENHEYKAARERHGMLFTKVSQLESELKRAVAVDEVRRQDDVVCPGKKIVLEHGNSRKEFVILGVWDIAPDRHIISYKSGIARTLLGKATGDCVEIEGQSYEIAAVLNADV